MFGIEVDINSEAIKAMGRMSEIASKELYQNIGQDLVVELKRQFTTNWKTHNINTNTVYGAIKKAFFPSGRRGFLTGSTLSSIKANITDNGVEAGPVGSWPNSTTEAGSLSLPFADVIKALNKTWMGLEAQHLTKPLRKMSKEEAVKGNVEMSWSASGGFEINWPDNYLVSHVYGLTDWLVKPHEFAGKSYRRNANKMEDFFNVNMEVEKIASNAISQRIDVLWEQANTAEAIKARAEKGAEGLSAYEIARYERLDREAEEKDRQLAKMGAVGTLTGSTLVSPTAEPTALEHGTSSVERRAKGDSGLMTVTVDAMTEAQRLAEIASMMGLTAAEVAKMYETGDL